MNKLSIMAKGMMIAMGMVGMAHADNQWTGFYAGVNGGLVFNNAQLKSQQLGFTSPGATCNTCANFSTFSPGMQLGYSHQFPNAWVSGIETNLTYNTNQKATLSCKSDINPTIYDRFTFRNQLQTSLKGRVGRALNWRESTFFPYLTTGASFANVGLTYKNEINDYYSKNSSQAGWLIGAGIEWAFKQNWSLRAEYYYVDYGRAINLKVPIVYGLLDTDGKGRIDLSSNNIVVALNYWL